MATIFPKIEDIDSIPYSERLVYIALQNLPNDFLVFHSVQWYTQKNGNSLWKENDFLILSPKYGMLVLEVKGGDITYKNGVFEQRNTRTNQITKLSEKKHNDPLSQAIDGKYHYREVIREALKDELYKFNIDAIVCFSSCQVKKYLDSFPLKYREVPDAILDVTSFENNTFTNDILKAYEFYNGYRNTKVSTEQYKKIKDIIAKDFQLLKLPSITKAEIDDAYIKLTNEQISLLDYISEQDIATIQGVAGTGKTVVAVEAAHRFSEGGKKVLFLCFNSLLYHYLDSSYSFENVDFYNIHSFIAKYNYGNYSTIERRVEGLYSIDYEKFNYDAIVIDEAQDFDNDEILYFKEYIKNVDDGRMLIFFDKNQLLTTKVVPEWITNSECRLILTKNCRNTKEIAITSYNAIDVQLKHKIKMVSGEIPKILFINSHCINDLKQLIDYYFEKGYKPNEITILSISSEKNSILNNVDYINGIKLSREKNNKDIFVKTASKFKGLESRVVIISDINEKCFSDESVKRIFYVACSRATHYLSLLIKNDADSLEKICKTFKTPKVFNKKGAILQKLKVSIHDFDEF